MKRYQWRLYRNWVGGVIAGLGMGAGLMGVLSITGRWSSLILCAGFASLCTGQAIARMTFKRGDLWRFVAFLVIIWSISALLAYLIWRTAQSG